MALCLGVLSWRSVKPDLEEGVDDEIQATQSCLAMPTGPLLA